VCIIALYVDDSILAGHQKAIDKAVKEIKSVFTIKVQGSLDDCRGCDINSTKTGAQLGLDSRQ
jgi:hypothetical protein